MRGGRGGWYVSAAGLAVIVVGLAAVGLQGGRTPSAPTSRATTPSPPALRPVLAPLSRTAPVPTAAGLRRALGTVLRDPALGAQLAVSVVDAASGAPLLESRAATGVVPASTAKIITALTALTVLPHDRRLTTRVLAGPAPGDVVLVGAGDPTLAGAYASGGYPKVARLVDLATAVRRARGAAAVTRVLVDDTLFTGPRLGPGWKPTYVTGGDVAPVSALEVDGGRASRGDHVPRVVDPALDAGRQFARLLGGRATVERGRAARGAVQLGAVAGPTVAQLVELALTRSDNDLAEALGRQIALANGQPASFDGETAAIRTVLASLKVPADAVRLLDASGLSPRDRIAPAALARLLARVSTDLRYGVLLSGLPVAGFDGTLAKRYRRGPAAAAAGEVRAKTGTLEGVSALAGLIRTRDGRLLAFDLAAVGVPFAATLQSQAALDRVAAVLASCGCR